MVFRKTNYLEQVFSIRLIILQLTKLIRKHSLPILAGAIVLTAILHYSRLLPIDNGIIIIIVTVMLLIFSAVHSYRAGLVEEAAKKPIAQVTAKELGNLYKQTDNPFPRMQYALISLIFNGEFVKKQIPFLVLQGLFFAILGTIGLWFVLARSNVKGILGSLSILIFGIIILVRLVLIQIKPK